MLGTDHPDTLTSHNNLAYAHWTAGRLDEATPLYKATLADRERVLGSAHPAETIARTRSRTLAATKRRSPSLRSLSQTWNISWDPTTRMS